MLKLGEVNSLSVFGLRQVSHCMPHFTTVDLADLYVQDKKITDWIWTNLSGRFYFDDHYYENTSKTVHMCKRVGFELPMEASFFSLMLSTINCTQ